MAQYFWQTQWMSIAEPQNYLDVIRANKASKLKPKKKEDVKPTSSSMWTSTQQPSNYLQVLEQRKQELKNKLDTTTKKEPTPILNFWLPVSQASVTNVNQYNPVTKKTENILSKSTTEKSSGLFPTANAWFEIDTKLSQQAISDINAWMPIEEFDKYYPELAESKQLFIQYVNDIKAWMPQDQASKYYPELFWETKKQPLVQDQYKNEWVIEQGLKSIPRWLMDTAQQIITWAEKAWRWTQNVLSKTVWDYWLYPVLNAIWYAIKWDNYTPISSQDMLLKENVTWNVIWAWKEALLWEKGFWETYKQLNQADVEKYWNQWLLSDITDIWAWASWSAFNLFKAPVATWLNIASEAPWTQYITQLFWTWIDKTSEAIANETWMDKNAVQNTIETFMNTLWFKAWKWTWQFASDIRQAYTQAPTKLQWLTQAGKVIWTDVWKWVYDVAKMPYDIAKTTIKAPYTLGKIWVEQWKNLYNKAKTGFWKENVTWVTEKWTTFEIEQTPWIKTNISDKIFNKDNDILAQQAIMPKATKEKTLEARKKSWQTALEWIKQLYEDNANGIIKSDIRNMIWGVEWVEQWLSYYWTKIWELTKNKVKVEAKDLVDKLETSLNKPFSWINASMKWTIQNIINEFRRVKNKASIEDLQNALSNIKSEIFDNKENISKLYKTNTWKALNEFLKTLEDRFNTTIENTTWNLPELLEAKKAYSKYKKIQKDFTDSLMVDLRNQWKWITWTAWKVAWIYELLQNPTVSWIFKAIALKQAGETMQYYKTRSWNYETLIRNLDREAIQRNLKSNTTKNDLNNSINSNTSDNAESLKPNQTTNVSNKPIKKSLLKKSDELKIWHWFTWIQDSKKVKIRKIDEIVSNERPQNIITDEKLRTKLLKWEYDPIIIMKWEKKYWIIDWNHRFDTLKELWVKDIKTIEVTEDEVADVLRQISKWQYNEFKNKAK